MRMVRSSSLLLPVRLGFRAKEGLNGTMNLPACRSASVNGNHVQSRRRRMPGLTPPVALASWMGIWFATAKDIVFEPVIP